MILSTVHVGITQTNCYVVGCEETREGVVIDPGGHPGRVLKAIEENGLTIRYVLNTHCHFDHIIQRSLSVAQIPLQLCEGCLDLFRDRIAAS